MVVLGEDIGRKGGVFGATAGLHEKFGDLRVMDTPLSECGIIGDRDRHGPLRPAPGAGDPVPRLHLPGLRPDRERGGEDALPLRRRVHRPDGDPHALGRRHPRRPLPLAVQRGVLRPHAGPQGGDARARRARRRGCCSPRSRSTTRCSSSSRRRSTATARRRSRRGPSRCRSTRSRLVREGTDVTRGHLGRDGADLRRGREDGRRRRRSPCEVIDLRSIFPWDANAVLESVRKTGRLVVVQEAPRTCGFGSEVAATVAEKAIELAGGAGRPRDGLRHAVPLHARARLHARQEACAERHRVRGELVAREHDHGVRVQAARHRRGPHRG